MADFGDFGPTVGEWASVTGEPFNEEWYGANPGGYINRMRSSASAWKRNQLKGVAQKNASTYNSNQRKWLDTTKGQLQAEVDWWTDTMDSTTDDQTNWYNNVLSNLDSLSNTYNSTVTSDKEDQSGYLSSLMNTYNTALNSAKQYSATLDPSFYNTEASMVSSDLSSLVSTLLDNSGGSYKDKMLAGRQSSAPYKSQFFEDRKPVPIAKTLKPDTSQFDGRLAEVRSLLNDTMSTLNKTWGYDPSKFMSESSGVLGSYLGGVQNFRSYLNKAPDMDGVTRYKKGTTVKTPDLAERISANAAHNQKVRAWEQQTLSSLSNLYNSISTAKADATNQFGEQKAFRVNQRERMLAQQAEDNTMQKQSRAETNSAKQTNKTRQSTEVSFDPNLDLLSLLTRGI